MQPDPKFLNQPMIFWANIRSISQKIKYTARGTGQIKVPTLREMELAYKELGLTTDHVIEADGKGGFKR